MKTNKPMLKRLGVVASALAWCAVNLHGQSAPTITTQPLSQTNLVGSNVTFSVTVSGTGPFHYQWQFNGTNLPTNIITTVAGNDYHGLPGYSGDGGAAVNASLAYPFGVATDASGNLYIADTGNNRIRKVNTNGVITTVAGNGTNAYFGDGGAATNASLNGPRYVILDTATNLYISDSSDNCIRKVSAQGIITTIAGGGSGGDGVEATNASLWLPGGLALDPAGNLYIADQYDERIRKVGTNGIITTVAGNGLHYFGPEPAGEGLYTGDGGPATNAELNWPMSVCLDVGGNLYIADHYNQVIRRVDTNGIITTVVGNGYVTYSGPDPKSLFEKSFFLSRDV
jgi:hypothetical protein